jgi:Flp pilus assembly protein TadG
MRFFRSGTFRHESGQSLLEAALITPLMLLVILNVINFGYFFVVALNVASAPRSGSEYAMLGFATPGALTLAQASNINSLVQADLASLSNAPAA